MLQGYKLVLVLECGSRASKRCVGAAFGPGVWDLIFPFRWPTRKAFVLRTDAAFAFPGLPNLCWCRNAGFRASKRCVGAAFGAHWYGWLVGWLVGWMDDWLVGWLVSW